MNRNPKAYLNLGEFAKKGSTPWNKGLTKETSKGVKNASDKRKGVKREWISDEKAYQWKGDKASYFTIHKWIGRKLGKAKECMFNSRHKTTRFEWANIYHTISRDIFDYISLCPSCHRKYDFTEEIRENFKKSHLGLKYNRRENE